VNFSFKSFVWSGEQFDATATMLTSTDIEGEILMIRPIALLSAAALLFGGVQIANADTMSMNGGKSHSMMSHKMHHGMMHHGTMPMHHGMMQHGMMPMHHGMMDHKMMHHGMPMHHEMGDHGMMDHDMDDHGTMHHKM